MIYTDANAKTWLLNPAFLPSCQKIIHLYQEPTVDTEENMASGISPTSCLPKLCDPLTSSQFSQSSSGLNLPLEEDLSLERWISTFLVLIGFHCRIKAFGWISGRYLLLLLEFKTRFISKILFLHTCKEKMSPFFQGLRRWCLARGGWVDTAYEYLF